MDQIQFAKELIDSNITAVIGHTQRYGEGTLTADEIILEKNGRKYKIEANLDSELLITEIIGNEE